MSRDRVFLPYRRVVLFIREDQVPCGLNTGKPLDPENFVVDIISEYLVDGTGVIGGSQMPAPARERKPRVKAQPSAARKPTGKPKAPGKVPGKSRARRAVAKLASVLPLKQEQAQAAAGGEP